LWSDLDQVAELIDVEKIESAETLLKLIKQKINWEDNRGLNYPQSVKNTILSLESLILDKSGSFENYTHIIGTVVEIHYGPSYLYFIIQSGKDPMTFIADAGLILNEEICLMEVGTTISIFYEIMAIDHHRAVKITCQRK